MLDLGRVAKAHRRRLVPKASLDADIAGLPPSWWETDPVKRFDDPAARCGLYPALPERPRDLDGIEPADIGDLDAAEEKASWRRVESWGDPIPSMIALFEERNVRVIEIDGQDGFAQE
ncbi:hypothetical protein ACKWRH_08155 [Bradyrhizobium sp. Pa8]|uniref:hypothetical protein n=1 Tax=Bradyrhizobium sp. Pa8 TaxID=3386552 RepID=UPI00403F81DB